MAGSYSKVTWLTTVVAATAGTGAAQTKGRAVCLYVAQALAVIALLGFSRAGEGTPVGFVA